MRLAPAVTRELALQAVDDGAFVGAGRQLDRHPVERALHVVGGGERLLVDPEHAEAALVGHAPQAGEDELGRQCDTGHLQCAAACR